MRRPRNGESGNILLLTAILMPVLLGMGALALDAGYYFDKRQRIGAAADSAAIAGANEAKRDSAIGLSSLTTLVRADTALNGYTHGSNNVSVTVECTDSTGQVTSDCAAGFVRVEVRQNVPGFLMKVLGRDNIDVAASAWAGPVDDTGCIYALASGADTPYTSEISVLGGSAIDVPDCRIISNEDLTIATGSTITAKSVDLAGTTCATCAGKVTGPVHLRVAKSADPFAGKNFLNNFTQDYSQPDFDATGALKPKWTDDGTHTLYPGVYYGNATNPAIKLTTKNVTYTFMPGEYYIVGGGISIGSETSVIGTGVSFYFTGNGVTYPYVGCGKYVIDFDPAKSSVPSSSTATITLSAPTSGNTEALLFVQDRNEPTCGSGNTVIANIRHKNMNLDGVMYFPKEHIIYGAWGGTSTIDDEYWDLVGHTVEFDGTSKTKHKSKHYKHKGPHSHSGHHG